MFFDVLLYCYRQQVKWENRFISYVSLNCYFYGLQTKKSDVQLSSVQVINNNTCASLLNDTYVVDASQACVIPTISYALSCKVKIVMHTYLTLTRVITIKYLKK